jgi:hypothetical protein
LFGAELAGKYERTRHFVSTRVAARRSMAAIFTFQPWLVCNNGPARPAGDGPAFRTRALGNFSMWRGLVAVCGLVLLAGCAGDVGPSVETPSMYLSMASEGAKVDALSAATMISQYRQNNGLGAVAVDPALMQLAEEQSATMAKRNKLDHDAKAPLAQRLNGSGYPAAVAVENVSAGYHTLAEAFSGWRDSPPHRANMLKGGVDKLGIAASYAPGTKYKVFWTLILASTAPPR